MEVGRTLLENLGSVSKVGDNNAFNDLVQGTVDVLLKRKPLDSLLSIASLSGVAPADIKESYAMIAQIVLQAAKSNADSLFLSYVW